MSDSKIEQIKEVIEAVKLYIQADGGDLEFVDYNNNVVTVKLLGACTNCVDVDLTYKEGLQSILQDEVDVNITLKLI